MRTDEGRREIRYETIIATLVGVSALFVSGYTAYVQQQQVRAAVWPILEYSTSNQPEIEKAAPDQELAARALDLAHACRKDLAASWGTDAWRRQTSTAEKPKP